MCPFLLNLAPSRFPSPAPPFHPFFLPPSPPTLSFFHPRFLTLSHFHSLSFPNPLCIIFHLNEKYILSDFRKSYMKITIYLSLESLFLTPPFIRF